MEGPHNRASPPSRPSPSVALCPATYSRAPIPAISTNSSPRSGTTSVAEWQPKTKEKVRGEKWGSGYTLARIKRASMDVQMQEWQILHWLQELLPASFDEITRLSRSSPSPIKSNTPASPSLAARNRLHAAPASGYDLCDLGELLRDGTVLCELVNQLRPGSIKHYTHRESPLSKVPFKMMENIYLFLQECKKIIPQQMGEFLFEPLDLVQKRMGNVYTTLLALRKAIDNPEGSGSGRKRSLTTGSSGSIPAVELAASSTENDNREQGAHARLTVAALADSCVQDQGALQAPRTPTTKKHADSPRVPITPTRKSVVWLSVDSRSRSPSPSTSFDGRRSDEDDDEDWETDPDYVNPTVPPVRLAVVEEPIPPKRANANPGAAVFGVKRGGCQKKRCPCPAYVQEEAKEGGPCLNCGHYPTKHSDMGRETLVDRFGHSYKNWLLPYKDIKFEFKIGDGAYGTVWRAKLWGKHVAVKQLKFELISDHVLDEFKREVEILCSLRHPNIVLFMGAVIEEGRLCIVTEILSNGSLADVIGSTHLEWSRCIGFASDACLGMNYLHQMGLIHRDLKSSNLLVDSNWTVKVADFGLSQYKGNNVVDSMAGTPGYIAPEVINGEPCTTKADVYAMGIILWELLTGRYPYAGYSGSLAIAVSVTNADRPPIPEDCPPDYRLLIEDCWHQNPHKRPTFEQILFRLRKIGNAARQSAYMRTPTKHKGATAMAIGRNSL